MLFIKVIVVYLYVYIISIYYKKKVCIHIGNPNCNYIYYTFVEYCTQICIYIDYITIVLIL